MDPSLIIGSLRGASENGETHASSLSSPSDGKPKEKGSKRCHEWQIGISRILMDDEDFWKMYLLAEIMVEEKSCSIKDDVMHSTCSLTECLEKIAVTVEITE